MARSSIHKKLMSLKVCTCTCAVHPKNPVQFKCSYQRYVRDKDWSSATLTTRTWMCGDNVCSNKVFIHKFSMRKKLSSTIPAHRFWARSQNCEKWLLAPSYLSVCPQRTTRLPLDAHKIWFILRNSVQQNQVPLKSDRNNEHFAFMITYHSANRCRENQNTIFVQYFSFKNRVFCILDPCPETSVRNHHYLLRNNPEEGSSHLFLLNHFS